MSDTISTPMLTGVTRPVVKAHMESLDERMRKLEDLITRQGIQSKDSSASDTTNHADEQAQTPEKSQKPCSSCNDAVEVPDIDVDQNKPIEHGGLTEDLGVSRQKSVASTGSRESATSSHNILNHIVSTQGRWSYDETSGRLRYFGATTNFDIYSGVSPGPHILDSREQERDGISVLEDVSLMTQDYLMDLYWTYYNSVVCVVHKEAFLDDQKEGRTSQYSAFLHITLLAMGMRFADSSRPDISHLILGSGGESRLQREARRLLKYELETPGGVPSVQALLVLGDLECAVGRDNTGWMYVGELSRFERPSHLKSRLSSTSGTVAHGRMQN